MSDTIHVDKAVLTEQIGVLSGQKAQISNGQR